MNCSGRVRLPAGALAMVPNGKGRTMTRKSRANRMEAAVERIQEGLSEIENLKTELEDWRDNMSGTNLETTQKFEELEEAIDLLDTAQNDIESALSEAENVEFSRAFG